jgi:stage IV sporulation protein FB
MDHFLIYFTAIFIHESGHFISARIRNLRFSRFEINVFGARLNFSNGLISYGDEFIVSLAGPFANVISVAVLKALKVPTENEIVADFILCSLSLAFINLLPIKSFDGGRMLKSILSLFLTEKALQKALDIISFSALFILWCFSVYLLLKYAVTLSLLVFSMSIFASIFLEECQDK